MICRNCGTEIADKAIVCYRCGTATTDPVRKPVEVRRRRSPVWMVIVLIVILLLGLLLARGYHLFGLGVLEFDPGQWACGILIDLPPGHA